MSRLNDMTRNGLPAQPDRTNSLNQNPVETVALQRVSISRRIGARIPMSGSGIYITFLIVMVSISAILALTFRLWPRYGSVDAALEASQRAVEQLDQPSTH